MAQTHHFTKFCENWLFRCGDVAIFRIFKMTTAAILDCQIHKILSAVGVWRVHMHHCTKFRQNRSIGCEDIKIFRFFKMAAVHHLWFVWGHIWTTNSEYLGVSITLQNLVMIHAVVFIIWTFQYLARLAEKMPIHAPKIGVLGQFDPINGLQYQPKPKGTPLRESASFKPISVKMWRAVWPLGALLKKGYK